MHTWMNVCRQGGVLGGVNLNEAPGTRAIIYNGTKQKY